MIVQNMFSQILDKRFKTLFNSNKEKETEFHRFSIIKEFLNKKNFNGFTSNDLFIMQFIKKGWGHDIAALSNMAEALVSLSIKNPTNLQYKYLMKEVVQRAVHPKVNPYKKKIDSIKYLGKYGYYLEHLNIILGCYLRIVDDRYIRLNTKVSHHLLSCSMAKKDYHADLLPYVKMKWSADQAAIIYSLWLFDQNNKTDLSFDLKKHWLSYMKRNCVHSKTGLFQTEVLGVKKYSKEPRGCSLSYLIHYMGRFSPQIAEEQWSLYKKYMMIDVLGKTGFREYLEEYEGGWTPDSGPIISGIGIAATGLGLNAASTMNDKKTYKNLESGMNMVYKLLKTGGFIPGVNKITKIGTDLLASSIWLNAETKIKWY